MKTLFTMGYARWSTKKRINSMIAALKTAGIDTLVDIRHSPCSSNPSGDSNYGPKEWNLQTAGVGMVKELSGSVYSAIILHMLAMPHQRDGDVV